MILTKKCPNCDWEKIWKKSYIAFTFGDCSHCGNTRRVPTLFYKILIRIIEFIYYLFKKKGVL